MKRKPECFAKVVIGLAWFFGVFGLSPVGLASAQGGELLCDTAPDPSLCGEVSPLIPMQSTEAVHMGLVWKRNSATPKILFHSRFPEFTPNDMADPDLVDLVIAQGALTTAGNQFNTSLRDVLHGFDPFVGLPPERSADDSFQRLVYGGFLMRQGLSQSVPTRIIANRTMERSLLFDIAHPDAFSNNGKFHTALLDEADFALNRAAFKEVGFSAGLHYNIYCNARVTLADGRVYIFGGHDMQSNNGLFKVQIFDPETETYVPRSRPCTRQHWADDPFGLSLFASDPNAPHFPGCNPHEIESTQPSDPSDMKYARWYPTAIPLPNNTILILGGFDQDASVGPDPDRVEKGRRNQPQTDTAFTATRVNQVVPEVYDPTTDRNIALENARMAFPLYPQAEVVQTGPGRDDWKVCTFGGEENYGPEDRPGGAKFFGPWTGKTWCLDVLAALRDPERDNPGQNHWELLDTASEARPYCCPTAALIEIDNSGQTTSHRWFIISGQDENVPTATIERIEFTDANPQWAKVGETRQPIDTLKAVLLPDGKVWLGHGLHRSAPPETPFEEREGLRFQLLDPDSGATRALVRTTVSRGLHGTATLLPDATVFIAGENREALVRPDDPAFPMETSYGMLPRGDPDLGVPNGQIYRPPYLFTPDGGLATRPIILDAPKEISYRGHFDITVAGDPDQVGSVVLLRSDHNTHSLTTGDRYVKLAFHPKGAGDKGELRVIKPRLPAQAIPGIYMLFVVDKAGVPSVAKQVRLEPET
jgi:Domain of unknown function (DUF1929)/Kelch motif